MPDVPVIQVATDAELIGKVLIAKWHPHLADANILYLFTDKQRKKCDRVKLGSASKANAMQRFLASNLSSVLEGPDYILLFDSNMWSVMEEPQLRALVDHELCHCAVFVKAGTSWQLLQAGESKEDYSEWKYGLRTHDIEEFKDVIDRHGFWKMDIQEQDFAKAVKQLALPEMKQLASVN